MRVIVFLFAVLLLYFFTPVPVYAQAAGCEVGGAATFHCLETIFSNAVKSVVSLAAAALFVMIVVGGFNLIFSGGDQKKLEQAKGTLTNAVLGIAIVAAAYLILQLIGKITGAQVTQFTVPVP